MTIVLIILGLIVVALAVILILASMKPDTFLVRRETSIKAPSDAIFPLINDFHRWREWSPYENVDADLKRTYSGKESGVGAVYNWEGKKAGVGRMEITESTPSSKIAIDLRFEKPFKANNIAEFTFEPRGGATQVAWAMRGKNMFIGKVMSLFMNFDRFIGKDFEKGLATLKEKTER